MQQQMCQAVDDYLNRLLVPEDPILRRVAAANRRAGLPPHDVAPNQGKLLFIFARMVRARRILEIGTLGGYSTLWLARALPEDGELITLECQEKHAAVARDNLKRAGLGARVSLRVGPALATLAAWDDMAPFDLIFIDADKVNNTAYLDWSLRLSHPGTVIIADNVIRGGAILDSASQDASVIGVRRFFAALSANIKLTSTALQTVGCKGWDGFSLSIVN
ncbi:O-methyltransferase [Sodalis sp. RH14]|uniref:O-methyltransferase n=1 Tax=Sodalis sp. RH14 TaxID=3394329 RepID=UPI0039B4D141